jgi:hypothetical protein
MSRGFLTTQADYGWQIPVAISMVPAVVMAVLLPWAPGEYAQTTLTTFCSTTHRSSAFEDFTDAPIQSHPDGSSHMGSGIERW